MKSLLKLTAMLLVCASIIACAADGNSQSQSEAQETEQLPTLNKIQTFTFTRTSGSDGYEKSALFLSSQSAKYNGPDLVLQGHGSDLEVSASTAGDDFSVITDLGNVPLEDVTSHKAFNWNNRSGQENLFKREMPVQVGHTYAVLIAKSDIRALYAFQVVSLSPGGPMTIRYAVKSYSIIQSVQEAPGFDWEIPNK